MQGPVSVASSARVGRVVDIAWAPLPAPVGAGSVLCAALDDGSLGMRGLLLVVMTPNLLCSCICSHAKVCGL